MKRRSLEDGRVLVEKYLASGLTQERFAGKARIHVSILHYWLRRLREVEHRGTEPVRFVELTATQSMDSTSSASIETPDGFVVRFEQLPHSGYLVDLIRGLGKQ